MRSRWLVVLGVIATVFATAGATTAQARSKAPRLTAVRCVPITSVACKHAVRVKIAEQVLLKGRRLSRGMRVTFRWPRGALATKLRRTRIGWTVRVPEGTRAGTVSVAVRDRAGRRSNTRRIRVVGPPGTQAPLAGLPAAFRGNGMWIWYVSSSDAGNVDAIAARARSAGMTTVFVKSADAGNVWSQFSPALVQALHLRGLRVCAWQFVYGTDPVGEARAAAAGAAAGADCLVIDAETAYEGRYVAAQRYMRDLRAAVGPSYPLGLTSFPYVDYHPRMPFSVFLAPGNAQVNLPQVYWKDIGGSVDAVSARTVAHNRIYGAPMAPLGQAYNAPAPQDIERFRALWSGYGAAGMSWWSWQAASDEIWATLARPAPAPLALPDPGWPALHRGATGDQVVWLQQHLAAIDGAVPIDGTFGASTETSLKKLQRSRNLPATGETDAATWLAVLALPVRGVRWTN
ncbi:MAG: peptidoglycan-binding domain-containing protein [Solirubrobacteraceae bacterium]